MLGGAGLVAGLDGAIGLGGLVVLGALGLDRSLAFWMLGLGEWLMLGRMLGSIRWLWFGAARLVGRLRLIWLSGRVWLLRLVLGMLLPGMLGFIG